MCCLWPERRDSRMHLFGVSPLVPWEMRRVASEVGFEVAPSLGYPKRSKHACIESDSSDDEVDERFPAFSCLACRPPLPKLKPYAQHCTAPSLDGRPSVKRNVSQKAMQRPLGAPRKPPPFAAPPPPTSEAPPPVPFGAPRHNCMLPRKPAPPAPAPAPPWRPQPPPPPPPDWVTKPR